MYILQFAETPDFPRVAYCLMQSLCRIWLKEGCGWWMDRNHSV